jgi:uncharacterized protein YndB with AHSA1/START domain
MRPVSASVTIDAPRERVFDLLCDLSLRPAFMDHFLAEYRLGRLDPVGVGASARFRLRESGAWLDTAVERAERPHLVRERGNGGRSNLVPTFTVWELAEGPAASTCEVTVSFWTEPRTVFDRARELLGSSRAFARQWARALERLKAIVETGASPEPIAVAGLDRVPAAGG